MSVDIRSGRLKIACVNWNHHDLGTPHFMTYLLLDGEAVADCYHDTYADAWERIDRMLPTFMAACARLDARDVEVVGDA